jgi:hypothetical protein
MQLIQLSLLAFGQAKGFGHLSSVFFSLSPPLLAVHLASCWATTAFAATPPRICHVDDGQTQYGCANNT